MVVAFSAAALADVTVHTWDIARAVGGDELLDERLVEHALTVFVPSAERFRAAGLIAAKTGSMEESLPQQTRLLQLAGRDA